MALLLSSSTYIKPIEQNIKETCVFCSKQCAKWAVESQGEFWCSSCFLYETDWGKNNVKEINFLVLSTETALNDKITGTDGVLTDDGADRIMVAAWFTTAYRDRLNESTGTRS